MPHTDSQGNRSGGSYGRFIGLGFTLILIFALPTVVGFFVDKLAGTLPLFLLLGLALGFVGGLYYVYRALQRLDGG